MNKKTLVIHPQDPTTDFLKLVYKDKDYTIFDNNIDVVYNYLVMGMDISIKDLVKNRLMNLIEDHDRIIIMGHGTPYGLLNPQIGGYLVDDSFANILREKEVISIWCHSDQYFKRNNIYNNQFHSGMIISEVAEEFFVLGCIPLDKEQILENMEKFATIVGECIEMDHESIKNYILTNYNFDDEVTQYNRQNILVF